MLLISIRLIACTQCGDLITVSVDHGENFQCDTGVAKESLDLGAISALIPVKVNIGHLFSAILQLCPIYNLRRTIEYLS